MAKGHDQLKVHVLMQDEMTDQGQSPFSSWPDTLPWGIAGAVEVGCAGAVGLASGGGLAVSRVLACCSSFCQESSCGSLRGPISPVGTGVLYCCDAGETPHTSCCWHCCPSLGSALLVLLDNRWCCQLCCGMSVLSCDARSGPQTAALCHPRDVEAVCAP